MRNEPVNIDQKLLVLYLLDEISQQGRAKVEAWLNSSEENREYYASLVKTWDETGKVDAATVAFDTNRAWERMNGRIGEKDRKEFEEVRREKVVGMRRPGSMLIAIAAVLIFGVVSGMFVRFLKTKQDTGFVTFASAEAVMQDTLKDGSSVVLNTHSELIVPKKFGAKSRNVELKGEAFFQVEPDKAKPFIIDAGIGQVRVLGTSFHVKAYAGKDLEVYVESGRVELSTFDPVTGDSVKSVLKAGERGMIRSGTKTITKPADIGPDELFWANKKLIFEETKLSLVFDLLKKHYDAEIEVRDTAILNCLLSAIFTDETIDQILEVVVASFDLELSKDNEKFIINGKGCSNEDK